MSEEDQRLKENATTLAKVTTSIFPAEGLAPWMSHYDKKTQSLIIMGKTIGDVTEELERQKWMKNHPEEVETMEIKKKDEGEREEELFDLSKLKGADYMYAFCMNSLAKNLHNYAPSVDGMRTKQGIAALKASNPGMAAVSDEKKLSLWQKLTSVGKPKDKSA